MRQDDDSYRCNTSELATRAPAGKHTSRDAERTLGGEGQDRTQTTLASCSVNALHSDRPDSCVVASAFPLLHAIAKWNKLWPELPQRESPLSRRATASREAVERRRWRYGPAGFGAGRRHCTCWLRHFLLSPAALSASWRLAVLASTHLAAWGLRKGRDALSC